MLTEKEALLIATQLHRLMKKDLLAVALATKQQVAEEVGEEVLDSRQAAQFLHMSYDRLKHIIDEVPHLPQKKEGGKLLFLKSELLKYLKT